MVVNRRRLERRTAIVAAESPSCENVAQVARNGALVHLDRAARLRVRASFDALTRLAGDGAAIYGLSTGVGALDDRPSAPSANLNLVRSHAAGVGPALSTEAVRAMMFARACDLAGGHSGVRPETLDAWIELLNRGVTPVVPAIGSVGASDLAPLAHAALVLAGEGSASIRGQRVSGREALSRADLSAAELGGRDGLALINGLSLSAGVGALAVVDADAACDLAERVCAMTMLGLGSSTSSVAEELDRALPGSRRSARRARELLDGPAGADRLREPLSTRCAHHVTGAARDAAAHARHVVEAVLSHPTDNPVIRGDGWHTNNAGNCDGSSLAHALDYLANACTSLATASERRIARLLDPAHSGLPAFLIPADAGANSGLMLAQYTAAAVVAELRTRVPAGVHSMPTCLGTEDHSSMSALAARRALEAIELVTTVLCIETLCATQAVDLRGVMLVGELTALHDQVRSVSPMMREDRELGRDIERVRRVVQESRRL